MSYQEHFAFWAATLAVLVSVLFVNFFIPIKTRLDHALATTLSAAVVWGVWGVVEQRELILFGLGGFVIVVFIADYLSTFVSFTNRLRNAIAAAIVFTLLYYGAAIGLYILLRFGIR
jgi:hypothetical protein